MTKLSGSAHANWRLSLEYEYKHNLDLSMNRSGDQSRIVLLAWWSSLAVRSVMLTFSGSPSNQFEVVGFVFHYLCTKGVSSLFEQI